jgi:hypothetical protein
MAPAQRDRDRTANHDNPHCQHRKSSTSTDRSHLANPTIPQPRTLTGHELTPRG